MMKIRSAKATDIPSYVKIQLREWGEEKAACEAKLYKRYAVNPGGILVAEVDSLVVGIVSTIRITSYDYANPPSWHQISDEGWCYSHVSSGSIVYGIDLSVSRTAPKKTAIALVMGVQKLVTKLGLKSLIFGGRMPSYYKYADKYTPIKYMREKRRTGRYLDPEIEVYSRLPGFEIVQLLPDYFNDPESLNYGVLYRWKNPLYDLSIPQDTPECTKEIRENQGLIFDESIGKLISATL